MLTTFAILALLAVSLYAANQWLCLRVERERADNLDARNLELSYALDDAMRDNERLLTSNGHLICEATTLTAGLLYADAEATRYRSLHMRRKGDALGVLFANGLVRPARKLQVWNVRCAP